MRGRDFWSQRTVAQSRQKKRRAAVAGGPSRVRNRYAVTVMKPAMKLFWPLPVPSEVMSQPALSVSQGMAQNQRKLPVLFGVKV